MAKKSSSGRPDRSDPNVNKSLAIRTVLAKMPGAKAKDVAAEVKKEYGHVITTSLIYMIKTKDNMAKSRERGAKAGRKPSVASPMNSAVTWVEAIKIGQHLLKVTGSVENAVALLRAIAR